MECNKDEAERAKSIAEQKFMERDYAGAKKFALKAQTLYPQLEGVSQMLTTFEVYVSSENKINGERDWYSVLGVDPWADEDTVRKQYRKFALMLHPDKNRSTGADGAFKLVSEAWSVLSDRTKRLAYNQKRNIKVSQQKFTQDQRGVPSRPFHANGFQTSRQYKTSSARATNNKVHVERTSYTAPAQKPSTFWTICNGCRTQYEYLRIYLNQTLLCPNCREAFLAVEKSPPPIVLKTSNWSSHQQHQNTSHETSKRNTVNPGHQASSKGTLDPGCQASNRHTFSSGHQASYKNTFNPGHQTLKRNAFNTGTDNTDLNDAGISPWSSFSGTGSVNSRTTSFSTATQAANVVQQAHDNVKKEFESSRLPVELEASKRMASAAFKAEKIFKKQRLDNTFLDGIGGGMTYAMKTRIGSVCGSSYNSSIGHFSVGNVQSFSGYYNKPNAARDIHPWEVRRLLESKARKVITEKLEEFRLATEARPDEVEKAGQNSGMRPKNQVNSGEHDVKKTRESSVAENIHNDVDEELEPVTITVPDPDFHNFDLNRAESSFAEDQVWAAYDDDDGMPRFYARILSVISVNPFKLKISWLNSRSNSELGPMEWLSCGFSKTCGDFRTGKPEISNSLNSFSHRVDYMKGTRGVIRIFPKKGDVWAVYRNWSVDWNENTPDETIHKYDMVEVLDDYNEEHGVRVGPLFKVPGFKTVFRRHTDPNEVRIIPRNEMFRLSHEVPYYALTGQEAPNAPQGCLELDPAATPLDLIEVKPDVSEAVPEKENRKLGLDKLH